MDQVGFVSRMEGNEAHVIVSRGTSCGDNCSSCSSGSCDTSSLSVKIKDTLGVKKGDFVEVRMQTKTILKLAFLVYMVPLILMVTGIYVGVTKFEQLGYKNYEVLGFLVGLALLGVSYVLLRVIDNKVKKNNSLKFEMVQIVDFAK